MTGNPNKPNPSVLLRFLHRFNCATRGKEAVQITASFGAASLEPASWSKLRDPELLVNAADRAVEAAQDDGRNCVRVYNPRPASSDAA